MTLHSPANLLGLDYRKPPPRRPANVPITDSHTHLRGHRPSLQTFFDAARLHGVERVATMTLLDNVPIIRDACGEAVEFIAVPDYRAWRRTDAFAAQWRDDIARFADLGARVCKFWAAPRALAEHGLTLSDPWLRPMIDAALARGMAFMVHVADPDCWYAGRYSDAAVYGTKADAYRQLEWFLDYTGPRPVIGAHFIGHPEDLDHLDALLQRYPQLMLDTSATKWICREISRQDRGRVRDFFVRHRERILFGSDLVLDPGYDFEHYASRYWVQRQLWESDYDGPSPIEDPDADNIDPAGRHTAHLRGHHLPDDVLRAIYRDNWQRFISPR